MNRVLIITGICLTAAFTSCKGKPQQASNPQTDSTTVQSTTSSHTAQNSLDIVGTYTGILPCADCPGVNVEIILEKDSSFTYNSTYIDRNTNAPIEDIGEWSVKGNILTLSYDDNDSSTKFFVGEGYIQQLDADGKRMVGKLAGKYILKKKVVK
jgi:uncharacterized lipoprotein NlpE involved in copper resistance